MKKITQENAEIKELKVTPVFYKNMYCNADIVINRGSSGSSKSYSIIQYLLYRLLTDPGAGGDIGLKTLVLRKSLPSLRKSTLWDIREIMDSFGVGNYIKEEKVELNFRYKNNVMTMGSVDDEQKLKCFSEDTDILTKNGWRSIKNVVVGDYIPTMDINSREIVYRPITNVFAYDYKGKMIRPTSKHGDRRAYADFCVTPNHKMIAKTVRRKSFSMIEAKDLWGQYIIPQTGNWTEGNYIDSFEIPIVSDNPKTLKKCHKFEIKTWLKFLGWYLSEGNTDRDWVIQITQQKEDGKTQLREDLKDFPVKITECGKRFTIVHRNLVEYLKQFGKSKDKFIPREILDLHPSLLIHLFNALMAGDGYKSSERHYTYCSSSKQLINDVTELAIKLGYATIESPINTQRYSDKNNPAWCLQLTKRDNIFLSNKEEIDYDGKVYCVEVAPYHTVLTRYNGKIAWTGNSTKWNIIWFEEATEFTLKQFQIINLYNRATPSISGRPNQILMSFNPVDQYHWIKTYLLKNQDANGAVYDKNGRYIAQEIHSTYKDNPYLPKDTVRKIELLQEQDYNHYRVYALGEWGRLEDLVYSNWDTCTEIPDDGTIIYGLDWGYNDPTALIKCVVKGNHSYEEELIYRRKLTNSDVMREIENAIPIPLRNKPIYCDSSRPDMIKELRMNGFNAKPAQKNIVDGIDFVKRMKVHILESSTNLQAEKKAYSWKKDKNGNVLEEPVDMNNHLSDGERYALYTHFGGGRKLQVRWL